jgi:hypothetical protein
MNSITKPPELEAAYAARIRDQGSLAAIEADMERLADEESRERDRQTILENADKISAGIDPVISQQKERLRKQHRIVRDAIEIRQRDITEAESRFSAGVCESLKPDHRKIVRELVQAVVRVAVLNQREVRFRENAKDLGLPYVDSFIRPMVFHRVGPIDDKYSVTWIFLNDCIEHGYVTRAEVELAITNATKESK